MNRSFTNKMVWLSAVAVLVATAPAQFFAQRSNTIRAGVAVLDSDAAGVQPLNYAPYVWYNLDSNKRIKPANLNFVNPVHDTQFTAATVTRWNALAGSSPPAGTVVQKQHAPYWELRLSSSTDEQLAQFDVLLIANYGNAILRPTERNRLRRFVEKGGVLWIDTASTTALDPVNTYPFPFGLTNASAGTPGIDLSHPLVNYPVSLTGQDLFLLQSETVASMTPFSLAASGVGALQPILATLEPESQQFSGVVSDDRGSYINAARLGDGWVVVTTRAVAQTLNRVLVGATFNPNDGATSVGTSSDRTGDAAAKLALNMVNLVSGSSQSGSGTRRPGSTPIDLGAPQLRKFVDPTPNPAPSTNAYIPPAIHKGAMVVSVGNRIRVYDVNPKQDLDGDGNPDDGVLDYAVGQPYDLIWESTALSGPISAPICIEVPNSTNPDLRTQVVVTDSTGTLQAFQLFPYDANGSLSGAAQAPAYQIAPSGGAANFDTSLPDAGPYPPTFHEGFLFCQDVQDSGLGKSGRIWIANPATRRQVTTGANPWTLGGTATRFLGDPSTPPTVGYIPIADNSGGVDKVIYVATRPNTAVIDANGNAAINSVWFGVKGENPASWNQTATYLEVQTRASLQGLSVYRPTAANDEQGLGVRLTVIRANGVPFTPAEMTNVFDGTYTEANGQVRFNFSPGQSIPVDAAIRIDYTIDYGTGIPSLAQQILRGTLNLPDDIAKARRILHGIALTPQGTMHMVLSSQLPFGKAGGSYLAIKEEGRGNFKVVNRFDLFNSHRISLNQAQTTEVTYPATFQNSDPLRSLIPLPGGAMTSQTFVGGPVIRDGVAYVTAKAVEGFIPYTIIMAFRAEPQPLMIRVGNLSSGFSILQPDLSRSVYTAGSRPDTYSVLQPSQYIYEESPGSDVGTIRIDNLSANPRGPILNCLSTSQPIIIRQNGQNDRLIEPAANNSRWNQMLWYTAVTGVDSNSPAFVSGKTLFLAGSSSWPSILSGSGFAPVGQTFAMDTEISQNDAFLQPGDPARPWFKQVHLLRTNPAFSVNPVFLWPSTKGITSFGDYSIRLQQSVMYQPSGIGSLPARGIVGGDGGVFAWSDSGIWGFSKGDFVVADEGRIIKLDAQGSPSWAMKTTYQTAKEGDAGTASQANPIVRPTRAYPLNDREVLIVDTGANRVVRADVSGSESRVIRGFTLDPTYRPAGFAANAPTQLKEPRDVVTYSTVHAAATNPFTNPAPVELWRHYLIADAGNKRLVEIVDRYAYDLATRQTGNLIIDGSGNRAIGKLLWHSPVTATGGNFEYTSLSRIYMNGRYVTAAGIGNQLVTRNDVGLDTPIGDTTRTNQTGNGGIVIFDGPNTTVINEVEIPAVGANVYWNSSTGSYNSPARPARTKRLVGLTSVTMRNIDNGAGGSELAIMFADNEGVFEVVGDPSGTNWQVVWMLDRATYSTIRRDGGNVPIPTDNPTDLRATYAKRLESGDVLVCNGYSGFYGRYNAGDPRNAFTGEVIVLDGSFDPAGTAPLGFDFTKLNFGFRTLSIQVLLNNKPGANLDTRGVVLPMFADKQ